MIALGTPNAAALGSPEHLQENEGRSDVTFSTWPVKSNQGKSTKKPSTERLPVVLDMLKGEQGGTKSCAGQF